MEIPLFYFIAITMPGLAMMAGHWFPWPRILGRDLARPEAYIYGTTWIVGLPTLLLVAAAFGNVHGHLLIFAGLYLAALASAGIATLAAYIIDNLAHDHDSDRLEL